jgi:hypothetical protein
MSDAVRISKEQGEVAILPELEALARRFDPQMTVTEFERPKVSMVFEWAVAATVALFLMKPYFESLMKELGKATGEGIVSVIKKQFAESKEKGSRLYSKEEISKLLEKSDDERRKLLRTLGKQHAALEIDVEVETTYSFRFVFPASLEEKDIGPALTHLAESWELIIQERIQASRSAHSFGSVTSTQIDDISVYVPTESRWLSRREMVKYLQDGKGLSCSERVVV